MENDIPKDSLLAGGQSAGPLTTLAVELVNPESVAAAAKEVASAVGSDGLQLLVNNAGICMLAPTECVPLQDYKRMYDINVVGVLSTTQAFLPLLRAGRQIGRIITMSSVAGHLSMPFWGGYSGSKHAVEGLCDCLRYALAPQGIPVVMVKPGPVRTTIWDGMGSKEDAVGKMLTTPELKQLYGDEYAVMLHEADKAGKTGIPVSEVVDVIVEAATCRSPKGRYHVGPTTASFHWLRRLVPDEVWFNTMNQALAREYKRGRTVAAAGAPSGPLHQKAV